jgi:hypothetical protein
MWVLAEKAWHGGVLFDLMDQKVLPTLATLGLFKRGVHYESRSVRP